MKDEIAKNIWNHLYFDFSRNSEAVKLYAGGAQKALLNGFPVFRKFSFPELDDSIGVTSYRYCVQLRSLFDRFIADGDEMQQSLLEKEALSTFIDAQSRVLTALPGSERAHRVLKESRRILKLVLGPCPDIASLRDWRVPEKASVGTSRSKGYLHEKLKRLSGTTEQQILLEKMLRGCAFKYSFMDAVSVSPVAVEKKWNKNRVIAPDTVASGIVSNAIGRHIEKRLRKTVGIDIKVQQHVHRRLVKEASKTGRLATLDLSAASDSISTPLLRRILPKGWFNLLRACRTRLVKVGKSTVSLQSFMTMGVGYTFPLQTAVFYALIQATKNLLRSTLPYDFPGIISVYGDDCIFPNALYPYVERVLNDLGFKVNGEKSFHTGHFRESCGEDCFRGHSVRPAFFKWDDGLQSENVYQMINLLLRRYHILEIPYTVRYLISLIMRMDGIVLRVPPNFPERAGIRVENPECFAADSRLPGHWAVYSPIYYEHDRNVAVAGQRGMLGFYKFLCLAPKKQRNEVVHNDTDIYNHLVEKLRDPEDEKYYANGFIVDKRYAVNGYIVDSQFVAVGNCEEALFSKWAFINYRKKRMNTVTFAPGRKPGGVGPVAPRLLVPSKQPARARYVQRTCETAWWSLVDYRG